MSFCPIPASRSPTQQIPSAPVASAMLLQPPAEAQTATPAASPSRAGLILEARSTLVFPLDPAVRCVAPAPALAARALPAPRLAASAPALLRPALHPDNAAPADAVDSMEVPGRFCPWILKYLRCVA